MNSCCIVGSAVQSCVLVLELQVRTCLPLQRILMTTNYYYYNTFNINEHLFHHPFSSLIKSIEKRHYQPKMISPLLQMAEGDAVWCRVLMTQ